MKPRTEREREVMRLHASLPAITKAKREWAIDNCFDAVGYICKGIVWCTKCGGQFEKKTSDLSVSLKVEDKAVCPHCGRKLELKVSRKKKIKDTAYMTVLTTQGRWQVFRHYLVDRAMYRVSGNLAGCDKPSFYVWEVVQNWIDEHGGELVVARPRKPVMGYYDSWDVSKKMELRKRWSGYTLDPYNINVYTEYPRKKVLDIFKRNGYKGKNPTGMSTMDMFKLIVCQNMAETLLKAEQYGLLELMKNRGRLPYWHSIKIAIRRGYKLNYHDATLWTDMVDALDFVGKDTHNAHYLCPDNLKEAHDYWLHEKQKKINKAAAEKKRKEPLYWEEEYRKRRERFYGLSLTDGRIVVEVIKSVKEMQDEADHMHHCVMSNEYYKKEDSLIMSAKEQGERLETIEVNLKTMKVVQSYGKYNSLTKRHAEILRLVNSNLSKIAELV